MYTCIYCVFLHPPFHDEREYSPVPKILLARDIGVFPMIGRASNTVSACDHFGISLTSSPSTRRDTRPPSPE